MEISKNNNILNQDLIEGKKTLKLKIYDYFFNMLNLRKEPSLVTLYIFHFIEIIQLISFAFSPPNTLTWNISENNYKYIYYCLSGFRLTPLIHFTSLVTYSIIFYVVFIIVIVLFIFLIIQILFRKEESKLFLKFLSFTQLLILPLKVIFFIPFVEYFLMAFNCGEEEGFMRMIDWGEKKCWKSDHMFFIILGIIGIVVFLLYMFITNYYYFYPFFIEASNTRLNSTIDQHIMIIKLIYIIQSISIKEEYVSISILLILSIFLVYSELKAPIYNNEHIELFLNLRNIVSCWSFLMLLIAKICYNSNNINNIIYLLLFGYPLSIYCFIMLYKEKEKNDIYGSHIKFNKINLCLANIKLLTKLINSFIKSHTTNINYHENSYKKDIIILKGIIEIHSSTCLSENCPLTKFIKNEGNFIIQKQCLLNHMSHIFNQAMKTFPHDILIRLHYIQFNYDQKYNLNCVKTTFEELRKMKKNNKIRYVIYCQESTITSMRLKSDSETIEQEQNEKIILEQSYQKMKKLISNITKLYAEFWGIFEAKVTNNLNVQKLYKLGEKLNVYLKELNNLWENDLKNKKVDFENESIAQLYSLFLREILWDNKKSDLVLKKIDEEHNLNEFNKAKDDKNIQLLNLIESQDYLIYVKANEKGNCILIQFSNNLCCVFGYERYELLNKPFEILLPALSRESFCKDVENYIKTSSNKKDNEEDSLNEIDKKKDFLLIKNKMGYVNLYYITCSLCKDNDFSDSFLIRMKLESVDTKSMYAFYILSRNDFSIESISSSALHLGLSMDLLKKYVIELNVLIRTNMNKPLNLFERYKDFENMERKITWVFPDIIYPKDDSVKNKERNVQDLIKASKKGKFILQIIEIKSQSNDIINGFILKIYESKKNKKDKINFQVTEFIPSLKNQVIFDLLYLKYIRTVIVEKKSGFRNLRENEDELDNKNIIVKNKKNNRGERKKKDDKEINEESSDNELIETKITKEKLLELQTKDSTGIKYFINSLSFYGKEVSLIKHRPNKEKYPTGKAQEPLIKISINDFTKRINIRLKQNPNMFKKVKINVKDDEIKEKNNLGKIEINNNINQEIKKNENKNDDIEEINKEILGDNSLSLKNIVNISSLTRIKYLDFLIFAIVIILTVVEFIITNNFLSDQKKRHTYFKYSYDLLNNIVYIKYFLTEGILANNTENYILAMSDKDNYIQSIKNELSSYHVLFTNILKNFNNPDIELSKKYKDYFNSAKLEMKTWNNGVEKIEYQPLPSAQTKMLNALVYIYNSAPEKNVFNINDKYIYELQYNLLNSHYLAYENIVYLMINDLDETTKSIRIKNIVIFSVSLIISIIYLYIFWKLMIRLDNDREKPVNLFLTIKNKIFEELKNSSENFSNKLLNKFFGVDENEEEAQQNYTTNVQPNDINITKFMALNEYKENNNKGNSFISYYIQLTIFFVIFNIIMIFKYLNTRMYYYNINSYIKIYNSTRFSETYLMTRIDITKQFLEDPSITNYEYNGYKNIYIFIYQFLTLGNQIADTINEMSKTKSFLRDEYRDDFIEYFYHDFAELINNKNLDMGEYSKYGFKMVTSEIFEMLRFLFIKYFIDNERDANNKNISNLINDKKFMYLDVTIKMFFRPWYEKLVNLIDSYFNSYVDYENNFFVLLFIFMLILICIFYFIIWKQYEEEFINKIEKSFDLINLIPEEIKSIIVTKLNETN